MLLLVFVPAVIAVGMLEFNDRYYYITASLIIICSFIPFLMIFEKRRPRARELVVIAVMTALGVAGRAAFYMLPQFKPIAATVIITGVSLGFTGRFHYGCINRICIQHVFRARSVDTVADVCTRAAGIHLRAGLPQGYQNKNSACTTVPLRCIINLFHLRRHHGFGICPYGGFRNRRLAALLAAYASGLPFNLIFAGATVVFLLVLTRPILNKLRRIKKKYGLLTG